MRKLKGVCGLATLLAASAAAHAQGAGADQSLDQGAAKSARASDSFRLEEILVTAQKREENLQDVPMSISVLSGDDIAKRGFVTLDDFARYVPGVTFQQMAPGQNAVVIRGIGGSGDRSTGLYLGDMSLTAMGTLTDPEVQLVDIERVEVLRGPQGTLYGASAMGGAIRYIPVAPDLQEFGGKVTAGYAEVKNGGSASTYVTGALNLPLAQDKLALRVVGFVYDNAGFIDYVGNDIASRQAFATSTGATLIDADDGGASQYTGGRVTLLWQPTENFSATLMYQDQEVDQVGSFEDSIHLSPYQDYPISFGDLTDGGKERRFLSTKIYNLTMKLSLDKFDLVSVSSRRDYGGNEARDISRDLPFAIGTLSYSETEATAHEVRASSKFDGAFNFLAGVYYEKNTYDNNANVPWIGTLAMMPSWMGTDPNYLFLQAVGDEVKQQALFAEVNYDLTDKLRLTVGGRAFDYDRNRGVFIDGVLAGGPSGREEKTTDSGTTGKVNLTYKPNQDHLVYAQWAQGFRLGYPQTPPPAALCDLDNDGILDGTSAPIDTDHVNPDSIDSYELGTKSTLLGGRVVLNAAVYHIDWTGIPGSAGIPTCGIGLTINAGGARSQGVEVDSTVFLTRDLVANFGFSVVRAEYTKNASALGQEIGDDLEASPFQANAGLQYNFEMGGRRGYVRGDYAYVGSYYMDEIYKIGGYGKVDVRLGVDVGKVSAALYGTNLTNSSALILENFGNRAWHLRPRTIGVDFGYKF